MKSLSNFHPSRLSRSARRLSVCALGDPFAGLTNNFSKPKSLEIRIAMLYRKQNSKWALGKYLAIVPLVGLVVLLTAARDRGAESVDNTPPLAQKAETAAVGLKSLGEKTATTFLMTTDGTTVRGVIKNAQTGEPLSATTIVVVGTTQGTNADEKGVFELKNVPLNSMLVFSHVGFLTKEFKITKPNQLLSISMQRREKPLDKVVVVSYGAPSRADDIDSAKTKQEKGEYTVVEQLPEFPGGKQELNKYLGKNIRYPSEAARKGVEGEVLISFTVNEEGAIRAPKIVRSVGGGIDEEAMRVVLGMPRWQAAKQHGQAVPMYYTLPIEFVLDLGDKDLENRLDKEKRQGNITEPLKKDGVEPATFTNYAMPSVKLGPAPATFTNYSFPLRLPRN